MTETEFTKEAKAIRDEACRRMEALLARAVRDDSTGAVELDQPTHSGEWKIALANVAETVGKVFDRMVDIGPDSKASIQKKIRAALGYPHP